MSDRLRDAAVMLTGSALVTSFMALLAPRAYVYGSAVTTLAFCGFMLARLYGRSEPRLRKREWDGELLAWRERDEL
jgi:hypothetical protein